MVNSETEQPLFAQGSLVEVTSNEEGFRGAWYLATMLESPQKSASKKRKKLTVEYKTLLTEDGSAPLKEQVDPSFIRPLPPTEEGEVMFEVNDAVDAKYKDGWWTGVVRRVLENSRYSVYFDNPPDIIEFGKKDLRLHWEWIGGKWVRPEKQQMKESIFSSGNKVEISLEKDIWLPAIVIKENADNSFLVKYQSSRNCDESETLNHVVNSLNIRPTPPQFMDRRYELLEAVEATQNLGWQAGVITKIISERRYKVFFKHGNEDREMDQSELRPYVEWVDGKWVSKSKETMIASDGQVQLDNSNNTNDGSKLAGEPESLDAAMDKVEKNGNTDPSPPSKKLNEGSSAKTPVSLAVSQVRKISSPRTGGTGARLSKSSMTGDQPSTMREKPSTGIATQAASNECLFCQHHFHNWKTKRQKVGSGDSKKTDLVKRNVRTGKSPGKGQTTLRKGKGRIARTAEKTNQDTAVEVKVQESVMLALKAKPAGHSKVENHCQVPGRESGKLKSGQEKNLNDLAAYKSMKKTEHLAEVNRQKRKRGRPRKEAMSSNVSDIVEAGKEKKEAKYLTEERDVKDCARNEAELLTKKGLELTDNQDLFGGKTNESLEMMESELVVGVSNIADDDQPLSAWFGGGNHSSSLLRVPFEKNSVVWKAVEAITVFRELPQQPHFAPLKEYNEVLREGNAISLCVTFSNLCEMISELEISSPKKAFDDIIEPFSLLEKNGFDITLLRDRMNELMSIKDEQNQLSEKSEKCVKEIDENVEMISKWDAEMEEIDRKIEELKLLRGELQAKKNASHIKINDLNGHVDILKKQGEDAPFKFKSLACAPWNKKLLNSV